MAFGIPLWAGVGGVALLAVVVVVAAILYRQPELRSKIDLSTTERSFSGLLTSFNAGGNGDGDNEGGFFSGPIMRVGLPVSVFIIGGYALLRLGPANFLTVDRIIYFAVFLFSAALIPGIIALNGPALGKIKLDGALGKLNWTLGMLTFGIGILVQRTDDNYEMWPAQMQDGTLHLYLDGKWTELDRIEHLSRLGWRPFGIHFEKSTKSLKPYLENFGSEDVVSDGGRSELEGLRGSRAGFEETGPSTTKNYHWILDAVRLRPRKSAAGASLINRAEVIEIAKQNKGGKLASWSNIIGAMMGLIIGGIMAFIIFGP